MKSIMVHYDHNGWSQGQLKCRKIFMLPSMALHGIACCHARFTVLFSWLQFVVPGAIAIRDVTYLCILFLWRHHVAIRSFFTAKKHGNSTALLCCLVLFGSLQSCNSKGGESQEKKEAAAPAPAVATEVFAVQKGMLTT